MFKVLSEFINFFIILCCDSVVGHGAISASAKETIGFCIASERNDGIDIKFNSFLGSL